MDKRQIIETTKEKLLPNNRYGTVTKGLNWLPLSNDERKSRPHHLLGVTPTNPSQSVIHYNLQLQFFLQN